MRRYVGQRKREMGFIRQETFVPQSYAWGQEAQIDWYWRSRSLEYAYCYGFLFEGDEAVTQSR